MLLLLHTSCILSLFYMDACSPPPPYLTLQAPLVAVDSLYYGKVVLTPMNIIMYNVFGKGGPDLYGTYIIATRLLQGQHPPTSTHIH